MGGQVDVGTDEVATDKERGGKTTAAEGEGMGKKAKRS
jgi:hypothetical protein